MRGDKRFDLSSLLVDDAHLRGVAVGHVRNRMRYVRAELIGLCKILAVEFLTGKLRKRVDAPGIFRLVDARIRVDPERLPADGGNGHQIIEGVVADADQGFGPRQQRGIEGLQARDHTVGLICTAADLAERSGKAELEGA